MKVFELQREEYKKSFEFKGYDADGEDIMKESIKYTGKITTLLHKNKQELLRLNSIPEWKAKITAEYNAVPGHSVNGRHVYTISREPVTII